MSGNEHHLQRVVAAADVFFRRFHRYIRDPGHESRGVFNAVWSLDPAEPETALAVAACELADALRDISDLNTDHLSVKARRGLRDLAAIFHVWIARWGWQTVVDSKPVGRKAYMAERLERFCELVDEYKICLVSWRRPAGDDDLSSENASLDGEADEAWQAGYRPVMPPGEAAARFWALRERVANTPIFSDTPPIVPSDESQAFHDAIRVLRSELPEPAELDAGNEASGPTADLKLRSEASVGPDRIVSTIHDDLAERLRRARPRAKLQAELVEFMRLRQSATYADIASDVYGDTMTGGDAIEQLVKRTNETLVEMESRVRFRCGGERVFKEMSPE